MRLRWLFALLLLVPASVGRTGDPSGAAAGSIVFGLPTAAPPADPFPLRRVWAPPAQLGELLKALPPGPVLRMPRHDFEQAVQAATLRNRIRMPQLLSARHTAALEAGGLRGTSELTLDAPTAGSVFLAEPWSATLADLKTADGRPVATSVDALGRTTWILPAAGTVALTARWTLRLQDADTAERCELGFPAAAMTVLELDLPADRTPVGAGVLGPFPGGRDGRLTYRVPLGRTAAELSIGKPKLAADAAGAPTFRIGLLRRLELLPGEATLTATLALEPLRSSPAELVVLLDPAWQLLEIVSAKPLRTTREGGRLRLVPEADWPAEIALKLTTARSRAATAAAGTDWSPPEMSFPGTLPGGDRWEVAFDPTVPCLGVDLGDYRTEADDGTAGKLIGLPVAAGATMRRLPRWRLAERDADYTVTEEVEFVAAPVPRWSATVKLTVLRGPLDQLTLKVPQGWRLSAAESIDDRLPGVTPSPAGLQWQRPARTGETVSLRYELTLDKADPAAAIVLPRVRMPDAAERDGTIAIVAPASAEVILDPAQGSTDAGRWKLTYRGLPPAVRVVVRNRNDVLSPEQVGPNPPNPNAAATRDLVEFTESTATAAIDRDGRITVTATARGTAAGATRAALRLVPEAQLVAVRIDGKSAPNANRLDDRLLIPWPADLGPTGQLLELTYVLPASFEWPGIHFPNDEELSLRGTVAAGLRRFPELDAPVAAVTFPPGRVRTIDAGQVAALGWSLGAFVFGLSLVPRLRRPSVRALWLTAAAATGAALFALPDGWAWALRPIAVGLLSAVAGQFLRRLPAKSAAALACLWLGGTAATAQRDDPAIVLIAPGADGGEVFVPQRLWDRLKVQPPPSPPRTLGVYYDGEAQGTTARFTAKVRLELADAAERLFELPWDGVRLESLTLDGKPAYAEALPGRADRIGTTVSGLGPHDLTAVFQVPIVVTPTGRELAFRGAEAPTTALTFRPPAGHAEPTCPSRRGLETLKDGTLTVDHGRGAEIRIRWRDREQAPPVPPSVRLAAVWDLSDDETVLTTAYPLSAEASSLRSVSLEVPVGWEPAGAVWRRADAKPIAARTLRWDAAARLWTLQHPVGGGDRIVLIAKFYPRALSAWKPTLKLPRLREATNTETLVAVRRNRLEWDDLERVRMIDYPADELVRRFGAIPELKLDRAATDRVFSAVDAEAELRLSLRRTEEPTTGRSDTRWTFGPETEVEATVNFSRAVAAATLELDCPETITIHAVRGDELATWSRFGPKLQLRFRKPQAEGGVQVFGRSSVQLPAGGGPLELPAVRPIGAPATVRLRLPIGWMAHGTDPQRSAVLPIDEALPLPAKSVTVKVVVRPPQPIRDAQLHGKLERTADGLRYSARLTFLAPPKQPLRLVLFLNDGTLGPPTIECVGMGQAKVGPMEATLDGFRRLLDVPADRPDETMTLILTQKGPFAVGAIPAEVRLVQGTEPTPWIERTLTVGPELQLKEGPVERRERRSDAGVTWITTGFGKWKLAVVPPTEPPPPSAAAAALAPVDAVDAGGASPAAVWSACLLLLGFAFRFGLRRPEFLLAFGLLAAVALGATTVSGTAFLALAGAGATVRLVLALPRARLLK